MADKDVIRKGSTSIEVYRSNDAAPDSWEDAKFWLTNELRRIQAGFFSADEVISILDGKIGASVSGGAQGPQGVPGKDGAPGRDGRDGVDGKDGNDADPVDLIYDGSVRTNKAWSSLKTRREIEAALDGFSGVGFQEAPLDGSQYARQNGEWAQVGAPIYIHGGWSGTSHHTTFSGGTAASGGLPLSNLNGSLVIGP